ncbi:hypothetical protein TRVL_10218 [Trypanosoma vivax]|nr:hypothetical protein TRVL_10218 [Trypanosoma vivax]
MGKACAQWSWGMVLRPGSGGDETRLTLNRGGMAGKKCEGHKGPVQRTTRTLNRMKLFEYDPARAKALRYIKGGSCCLPAGTLSATLVHRSVNTTGSMGVSPTHGGLPWRGQLPEAVVLLCLLNARKQIGGVCRAENRRMAARGAGH